MQKMKLNRGGGIRIPESLLKRTYDRKNLKFELGADSNQKQIIVRPKYSTNGHELPPNVRRASFSNPQSRSPYFYFRQGLRSIGISRADESVVTYTLVRINPQTIIAQF